METTKNKNTKGRSVLEELRERLFSETIDDLARPIKTWHWRKPAKRTAFLLFNDNEAHRWVAYIYGNPRSKFHTATSLDGLVYAMKEFPELYDSVRACVRCVEREQKKQSKQRTHGKDRL